MRTREELLRHIEEERAWWHDLLREIVPERMEEPGPMGDWTFKDLVAHLNAWRERWIRRLEGGPGYEPPPAWPAHLDEEQDVDAINDWIYEQNRDRPLAEVLEEADRAYERLAAAIAALPDEDLTTPGRFAWLGGRALAEVELFLHLHEEHEPDIRAWLARR